MEANQLDKLIVSLSRIASAILAASVLSKAARMPSLKEVQTTFTDCYMIVDPAMGTKQQDDFQERIDKKEW